MHFKKNIKNIIYYINVIKHRKKMLCKGDCSSLLEQYKTFVYNNKDITYSFEELNLPIMQTRHSFVGAISYMDEVFLIPNDFSRICRIKDDAVSFFGELGSDTFKYTGACVFKNKLILFPRSSGYYVIFDFDRNELERVSNGELGNVEHHYGGICTEDGIIFQPPRNSNNIMKFDIKNRTLSKIALGPKIMRYRYCGSVLHPNGLIYFLPENGYVIKFNPKNGRWAFIGKKISGMVYDAKIGCDGNIYGFSGYKRGMLYINVESDDVEMIYKDIYFGSYGTKVGVNGRMYSIPGNSNVVWEFDPSNKVICRVHTINGCKWGTKYAGGAILTNGTILASPAQHSSVLKYIPSQEDISIPSIIFENFFSDNY